MGECAPLCALGQGWACRSPGPPSPHRAVSLPTGTAGKRGPGTNGGKTRSREPRLGRLLARGTLRLSLHLGGSWLLVRDSMMFWFPRGVDHTAREQPGFSPLPPHCWGWAGGKGVGRQWGRRGLRQGWAGPGRCGPRASARPRHAGWLPQSRPCPPELSRSPEREAGKGLEVP